jgi:hypothetical protein
VQIITTDEETQRGLRMGAMGALTKPIKSKETLDRPSIGSRAYVQPRTRRLLIAVGDRIDPRAAQGAGGRRRCRHHTTGTGADVLAAISAARSTPSSSASTCRR